jgi:acetyl-CoA acetyltransferase
MTLFNIPVFEGWNLKWILGGHTGFSALLTKPFSDGLIVTGPVTANMYGAAAMRHMYEYGTTSEQLAWVKVAASHHAQHNPHALLREVVTVADVIASPIISDPLHRLDDLQGIPQPLRKGPRAASPVPEN